MSELYKKIAQARARLNGLRKTGNNAYTKYDYFELGDFLPEINRLAEELGFLPVVSFEGKLPEGEGTARLTVYDTETEALLIWSLPFVMPEMKGGHTIQNLGAAQTYYRRYLYMIAFEISEADAIDGGGGGVRAGRGTQGLEKEAGEDTRERIDGLLAEIAGVVKQASRDGAGFFTEGYVERMRTAVVRCKERGDVAGMAKLRDAVVAEYERKRLAGEAARGVAEAAVGRDATE
jgi:hypothetical protein